MDTRRLAAKPVGIAAGAMGAKAFHAAWRRADQGREVPEPADSTRSWRAVLFAAVIQGALFAAIHAAVERSLAGSEKSA